MAMRNEHKTTTSTLEGIKSAIGEGSTLDDMILGAVQENKESRNQETKKPRKQDNKVSLEQETKELTKGVQTKIPMSLYQRVVELKTISQATGRKELNTIDKIVTEALTRLLDSELKS